MNNFLNVNKKIIVISAINLRSGGTLSILNDCLRYLDNSIAKYYEVLALVHNKSLIIDTKNIGFIEFPKSISSYLYRIYYEYFYFKKLSKNLKPYLWLSLHDISPNVDSVIQAVYCHNPSPFYKISLKEFFLEPKFGLFTLFYKWLYKINIHKNKYVIVQQDWIRKKFVEIFKVKNVIVSYPEIMFHKSDKEYEREIGNSKKFIFFYPSFPRVFKNFEIICEAVSILNKIGFDNFKVFITISGNENRYAKWLYKKYKNIKNITFIGIQTREEIFRLYYNIDCLIFPSKIETWGLPISEFQSFNKPILAADLPYARETIGTYDKVRFFDPTNSQQLATFMQQLIEGELIFEKNYNFDISSPFCRTWEELFEILLKEA